MSSIQPIKLANRNGEVKFQWKVADFERITDLLHSDEGQIVVLFKGYYGEHKQCLVEANIKAKLLLECQTTFEPIDFDLNKKVVFCPVVSESQFAEVDEDYEPVLMIDGFLDVAQIIEDELILSIPIVANKPAEDLDKPMSYGELDEEAIALDKATRNPFAVLKDLKKT